jgi:hypothetical protein
MHGQTVVPLMLDVVGHRGLDTWGRWALQTTSYIRTLSVPVDYTFQFVLVTVSAPRATPCIVTTASIAPRPSGNLA